MSAAELGVEEAAEPAGELQASLRRIGHRSYHHRHPFNLLMHAGLLDPGDLRIWTANRYYYQTRIPIKDALILAKAEDPAFRRVWVRRLRDHDGDVERQEPGGLELWRRLGEACGLSTAELESHAHVLPAVRAVCDSYVELVRDADLVAAVASSLTEAFAGELMKARVEAWKRHYPWVADDALAYFGRRVARSAEDARFATAFVEKQARTVQQRERCLDAFARKCAILWTLLDAVYVACRGHRRPRITRRAASMRRAGDPRAGYTLLVVPERAYALNATAACFIECCDGRASFHEIAERLAIAHGADVETVEADLATFVGNLEVSRLLAFEGGPA